MGIKTKHIGDEKISDVKFEKSEPPVTEDYTRNWPKEQLKSLLMDRISDKSKGVSSQEEYRAKRAARSSK